MAEIKIKIDSSEIDAAIAKVSHLLELVERLPAGRLGTETAPKQPAYKDTEQLMQESISKALRPGGSIYQAIRR